MGSKRISVALVLKVFRFIFQCINAACVTALLTIHFIIRESTYKTSLFFYSFPLPVIISIVLFLSVFIGKKFRSINLVLAGVLLLIWLGRSFKISIAERINNTDVEVVFWNASHDRDFIDVFKQFEKIPNVVVLSEYHGNYLTETKKQYPNYYFYENKNEAIGVFSKQPISVKSIKPSKYNSTVINFETYNINFYAVDVSGSFDVPRSWELNFVSKNILNNKNTLVLGDFNVPYESELLKPLKTNFNHAFNKKGFGFRETWFYNLPLLSLDHIWVSKDLKILKTNKVCTFKSDHAIIKTVIKN